MRSLMQMEWLTLIFKFCWRVLVFKKTVIVIFSDFVTLYLKVGDTKLSKALYIAFVDLQWCTE